MDLGSAMMAILIGVLIKGAVMALSVALVIKLFRPVFTGGSQGWVHVPEEHRRSMKIVWCSLLLFVAGELVCAVEAYILMATSDFFAALHSLTSALAMGLFGLGMYLFFDKRIIQFAKKGCVANRLCKGCTIVSEGVCKLNKVTLIIAILVVLMALYPFLFTTETLLSDTLKYALPFESWNHWYDSSVVPWIQSFNPSYETGGADAYMGESSLIIEYRIMPGIALLIALVGFVLVLRRNESKGAKFLALAGGILSYCYLEVVVYGGTQESIAGSLGHEGLELWFIIAMFLFLPRAFPNKKDEKAMIAAAPEVVE